MKFPSRISWFFGAWAAAVILLGGALTSFHQPFRLPEAEALSLTLSKRLSNAGPSGPHWRVTHLLSGGCGCSRRVMVHLLRRGPVAGVSEEIILVDGEEAYLPGTPETLASLRSAGFETSHLAERDLALTAGVHGVPLLLVTSPKGKVAYLGGYGAAGDKDDEILRRVRAGFPVTALPVLGCAIGNRTRRLSDPFRLKY